MSLPATLPNGFLPPGIHAAKMSDVAERFGTRSPRRQVLANRLHELLSLVRATGRVHRVFLWGSFVTDAPFPRDLDVFLLMEEGFDREVARLTALQKNIFDHERARVLFETDVFWATESVGEEALASWLSVYQLSRDMVPRGIVEVVPDD